MSFARGAVFIVLLGNFFVSTQPSAHVPRGPGPEQTRAQVTELLTDFLAPGKNDKPETHERFWAEELVYTTSGGIVKTKADIRKSFVESALPAASKTNPAVSPPAAAAVYSAEDVLVRPYGEIAALMFRLVAKDANGETTYYRNSAAFIYRDGRWQAITWQATKVPPTEKPTK